MRSISICLVAGLTLTACSDDVSERMLAIEGMGVVVAQVYLDENGNGDPDPVVDSPASGVRVALLLEGAVDTVATAVSGSSGTVVIPGVPIGRYRLAIAGAALGDSLQLSGASDTAAYVVSGDSVRLQVGMTWRLVSSAELDSVPAGRRVFVEGVALHDWAAFGDSTLHVADAAGVARAVRVRPSPVKAGDSVRVSGRQRDVGGVVVDEAQVFTIGGSAVVQPRAVTTALAAAAAQHDLRGRLVSISDAAVLDTTLLASGDHAYRVDDGSGPLDLVIDRHTPITIGFVADYQDHRLDATGILVADANGDWVLKPRQNEDVDVLPYEQPPLPDNDTLYTTDFADYPGGLAPPHWTVEWDPTPHFRVQREPSATGGKVLEWSATGISRNRFGLAFDPFRDARDQEVYTEARVNFAIAPPHEPAYMGVAAVRMSGTGADEHGYVINLTVRQNGTRGTVLATWIGGAYTELASLPYDWQDGVWYSVRLQAVGTDIRARVWPRGDAEPALWHLQATQGTYETGAPGVPQHDPGEVQWDVWQATIFDR